MGKTSGSIAAKSGKSKFSFFEGRSPAEFSSNPAKNTQTNSFSDKPK